MLLRGDCLSCVFIKTCKDTDVDKILNSYTCPLFQPVEEAVLDARILTINKYGERTAVLAMIDKGKEQEND